MSVARAFVIWSHTARAYVAPAGQERSFTGDFRKARKFATREAAERECCGDEKVEGWTMSRRLFEEEVAR
jgi:hypothetical protein